MYNVLASLSECVPFCMQFTIQSFEGELKLAKLILLIEQDARLEVAKASIHQEVLIA